MTDYQGNQKGQKKKDGKEPKDEKHIEKVVTTPVIERPKSLGRKFHDVFLGGSARQAAGYVAADVLLPALRNLIVDIVTKYTDRLVYGENMRRRPPGTNYHDRYRGVTQYRPLFQDPRERDRVSPIGPPRPSQNRHEINDVILGSREEAELVIERLGDILAQYDVVALADLYDLLGLETSHVDNKWGWTSLGRMQVRQTRQGYLLELPQLEAI